MDILSANKAMAGGGSGVVLHIVDSGVNPIPELAGVLTVVPFRGDARDGGTSGTLSPGKSEIDYSDRMGHGTMMASVAHRQAPKAQIYAYNALPDGVQVYANEALAHVLGIVKADKTHRHIVSISASGDLSRITAETMHSLIRQLVALDCPVVCAAGNDGKEALTLYPACFPEPITASAVNSDSTRAGFSTWHNEVDFAEIGVGVPCCDLNGRETTCDGTSPATAVVAGKLACMWSKRPTLAEPALYEAAKKNCIDLGATGRDALYGWGWIAKTDVPGVPRDIPKDPTQDPKKKQENKPVESAPRVLKLTTPRMTGADVKMAQERLNIHGYKVDNDGIYGRMTAAAVTAFQRVSGLVADGICGAKTWAALDKDPSGKAARFIAWLKGKVGDIYVWGGQGETDITEAWIRRRETSTANANKVIKLWKKRVAEGRSVAAYDCSGLITAWLLSEGLIPGDLSSRGLWRLCTCITRAELVPGDLLFRKNALGIVHHVGVYIGDGEVIEARGREYGVVQRGINASGADYWTDCGRLGVLK